MAAPVAFRHTRKGEAEESVLMTVHASDDKLDGGAWQGDVSGGTNSHAGRLAHGAACWYHRRSVPRKGVLFLYLPHIMHVC